MSLTIRLAPFGIEFACGEDETILTAALRQGIGLRYGCKHGGCGTCKAKVLEGEIDMEDASGFALMEYERDAGMALLCSAYPLEDVVVDLGDYEEAELSAARPIREHRCTVTVREAISPNIWRMALHVDEPSHFAFDAGQFVEINVGGTDEWRAYSMATAPGTDGDIEFLIKHIPEGRFSSFLVDDLSVGEKVRIRGPYGQFRVSDGHAPIVMVAGGSGMAPILAMLKTLAAQRSERDVVFYYGARSNQDLICGAEIEQIERMLPSFRYIPVLSELADDEAWRGETGLVTEVIDRLSENLRGFEAYLCGPPAMIDSAVEVLRKHGTFSSRIRYDKFVSTADKDSTISGSTGSDLAFCPR